jgi:hypothetical protein
VTTVLYFSRDPGPTNQLVAVHELLARGAGGAGLDRLTAQTRGAWPHVVSKPPGDAVWRRGGIAPKAWPTGIDDDGILRLLDELAVRTLVTGTSDIDEPTDRRLWRLARARGIASHVFLDHPASLDRRFFEATGEMIRPDHVYAPTESYRAPLERIGIAAASITIVGDLHLAHIKATMRPLDDAARATLREGWNAAADERVLLFVSECSAEMAAVGRPATYDEFAMLERLIALVRRGATIAGVATAPETTRIVVRPHPRDAAGKYDAWTGRQRPAITVSAAGSPIDAALAADAVVGMDSTLLREAAALDRPVVSLTGTLQPGIPRHVD